MDANKLAPKSLVIFTTLSDPSSPPSLHFIICYLWMRAGEPQKREKRAGERKGKPKENWMGKYRGAEEIEKKRGEGRREGGREKLEVTTDICEICLKYFKPSRGLVADLPQLIIAQRIPHRTKPFSQRSLI